MSNNSKTIVVYGATGQQGGSVARALLSKHFKVRAITRDVNSAKSKELKNLGCEVVKGDIEDSKEEIVKTFQGCHGLFLVTNFWAYFQKEEELGKKAADAALQAGIKHIVFSGLSPINKISQGKLSVPHFDLKFKIEEHIRSLNAKNPSFECSFVYAPFYMQNLSDHFLPKKSEDGSHYVLSLPLDPKGLPLDLGDINNIGHIVTEMFANPLNYQGTVVPFSGSQYSGDEIASIISKTSGKECKFKFVPPNVFEKLGFPGAKEMADMFVFYSQFGAFYGLDLSIAKKMCRLTPLEEFLKSNDLHLK